MKFRNKKTGEVVDFSPYLINSALLSAQNRQRYYWCNWAVSQPEDKCILLANILEGDVDKKFYLSEKLLAGFYAKKERRKEKKSGFDKINISDLNGKSNCLTARYYKMSMSDPYILQSPGGNNPGGVRSLRGKTPSMTANAWHENNYVSLCGLIRKLTPIECERLQTLPDDYTAAVSNTQRYKALGNGWTVDVIKHILECGK